MLPATYPDDEIGKHSGLRNRGDKLEGSSPSQGTKYASVAELEYASGLSPVVCEFESHRGYNSFKLKFLGHFNLKLSPKNSYIISKEKGDIIK